VVRAGGKRVTATGRGKKSCTLPSVPCLETDNPQSVCSMATSLAVAESVAESAAADVSSSLEVGASVECTTSDQAEPNIMLGKFCSCVGLLTGFCLVM